jgi:L-asparaginase II
MNAVPLVRVRRSGLEESVHLGHVAVCDARGRLVAWAGDPSRVVFARSCMKPLQATVSLAAIADLPLPDREMAVMCASHNGEAIHVRAVRALLKRAGLDAEALRNPPGYPLDPDTMARSRRPRRELQNCSGKHAGMLLACIRAGWDPGTYLRAGHPLQRRITRAVSRATGRDHLDMGVDGCGVPVHGMPLRSMATLFARLTRTEQLGDLGPPADLAVRAMQAEPYLVGGKERLDTDLMTVCAGVVAKEGAEALICAGVLPSGLGVAVKVADGGWRATAPALIHALRQIDAITDADVSRLAVHARPAVLGGGRRVGEMAAIFNLERR